LIDFERTLGLLGGEGVRFVIVGGLAVTIHGSAHVTFDLDICYDRAGDNLARLTSALRPVNPRLRGAPPGLPFRFDEETLTRGLNFTLSTEAGDIDLLGEITGLGDYAAVEASSISVELFGRSHLVLTLDALIASKRAAGRPKDLQLLPELEALREVADE